MKLDCQWDVTVEAGIHPHGSWPMMSIVGTPGEMAGANGETVHMLTVIKRQPI